MTGRTVIAVSSGPSGARCLGVRYKRRGARENRRYHVAQAVNVVDGCTDATRAGRILVRGGAKELALRVWRTQDPELRTELTLISWLSQSPYTENTLITKQQQQLLRTLELSDIIIGIWNLDITAFQEVRWEDSGSITSQGMTMFYSGGTKYDFTPTEDKHDDIKTAFYDELEMLYDSLPNWKPKIGKETMYKPTIGKESLHRETNEIGSMLVTFASNRNMVDKEPNRLCTSRQSDKVKRHRCKKHERKQCNI
ncbi:craniofacial development protein 2-like [Aphis craccivora]|uniref:Craniofacial development protein 2-like n=1 Tax=Aphis craccivora TaxID=307492 RepID=A0A6G0YQ67_APHCR|nr:craniofacial development protein 2-like [Aphis craccivora]